MPSERCITPGEVRLDGDGDTPTRLVGFAARYYDGSPGTQYMLWPGAVERIAPGAFDRAIKEDDVVAVVNHDASLLLGRSSAGTLRLSSEAGGLSYTVDLPDTNAGRDARVLVGRGDMSGSSFQFQVTAESWTREGGIEIRTLEGIKLRDVGPVTHPAYKATSVDVREAERRFREHYSCERADAKFESWKLRKRLGLDLLDRLR